jgi:hypothetical protein
VVLEFRPQADHDDSINQFRDGRRVIGITRYRVKRARVLTDQIDPYSIEDDEIGHGLTLPAVSARFRK